MTLNVQKTADAFCLSHTVPSKFYQQPLFFGVDCKVSKLLKPRYKHSVQHAFVVSSSSPVSDLLYVSHVSLRLISPGYQPRVPYGALTRVCYPAYKPLVRQTQMHAVAFSVYIFHTLYKCLNYCTLIALNDFHMRLCSTSLTFATGSRNGYTHDFCHEKENHDWVVLLLLSGQSTERIHLHNQHVILLRRKLCVYSTLQWYGLCHIDFQLYA